jgi:hypothetical protein
MATKHRSVVYLKALMPLLSEEEQDWDTIEELFVHASTHINNSLAAFRSSLKQPDLPLTTLSDNKPITPKAAEAVFACAYCFATGPVSEGDKHQCDEGAMALLLRDNRCEVCGGYVSGADLVPVLGGAEITVKHKDPALCELPAEGPITDEGLLLPDLTTPVHKKLPDYLCFYCGDGFHERGHFTNHLTTTHGTEEVTLISFQLSILGDVEPEGTPVIRTQMDDYTREQVYTALNLGPEKFLWRWSEGSFDWCSVPGWLVAFRDLGRWYVQTEKFIPGAKYACLLCACELGCDDVDVHPEGDVICHDCSKPSCSTCSEPILNAPKGKKGKLLCEGCNEKKKAEKAAAKLAKKTSAPEVTTH